MTLSRSRLNTDISSRRAFTNSSTMGPCPAMAANISAVQPSFETSRRFRGLGRPLCDRRASRARSTLAVLLAVLFNSCMTTPACGRPLPEPTSTPSRSEPRSSAGWRRPRAPHPPWRSAPAGTSRTPWSRTWPTPVAPSSAFASARALARGGRAVHGAAGGAT